MARKPETRGTPITEGEAQNASAYYIDKQTIDDLFEEANQWLVDEKPIASPAEAEGLEKMLLMARAARKTADDNRVIENKPFDDGKKAVQAKYNALFSRADLIISGVLKRLTPWRDHLAEEQRKAAAAIAAAAEEASRVAQQTVKAAGSDLGAQEIAASTEETARRLDKAATKAAKNIGVGLRMRTVWDYTFETTPNDLDAGIKKAIAHVFRNDREKMIEFIRSRIEADIHGAKRDTAGVIYSPRKEAY